MPLSPALAIACLSVVFVFYRWLLPQLLHTWRLYKMMAKLPGPPGVPILGNYFFARRYRTGSALENMRRLCAEYGTLVRLCMPPVLPLVIVQEPDDIKAILGNTEFVDKPGILYNPLKMVMGSGLAFHPRGVWKPIRTAVANSLHKRNLTSFVPAFSANAAKCATEFVKMGDQGCVFDVTHLCGCTANFAALDTILSSNNSEIPDKDRKNYVEIILEGNRIIAKRLRNPWLMNDWLFSFTKDSKVYNRLVDFTTAFVKRVVASKRALLARETTEGNMCKPDRHRRSFLDYMLSSETPLNIDLESEARFILLAASGSSMEALSFAYYVMSIRKDWQERIVKELHAVFGSDALRPVEDDDLPHLELTERFIKEILRLFPVVPTVARAVHRDLTLPSGHTLPRGCIASFLLPALHRDPRWWERPEEFDPDRFLPENARGRHPFAFLPFSGGPRNCVAYRYAMAFLKTHIATVLRRVRLLPAPGAPLRVQDVPVRMNLTLAVRGGANVIAQRRVEAAG